MVNRKCKQFQIKNTWCYSKSVVKVFILTISSNIFVVATCWSGESLQRKTLILDIHHCSSCLKRVSYLLLVFPFSFPFPFSLLWLSFSNSVLHFSPEVININIRVNVSHLLWTLLMNLTVCGPVSPSLVQQMGNAISHGHGSTIWAYSV